MLKVYTYANCDTCRGAVKWLRARELAFEGGRFAKRLRLSAN